MRCPSCAPGHVEEVNEAFETAAAGPLKGILGYETRPRVL